MARKPLYNDIEFPKICLNFCFPALQKGATAADATPDQARCLIAVVCQYSDWPLPISLGL
jgi:hypothetical protein